MTIKLSWGWRIAILYLGFMGMILSLVIASSRQKFDLVSQDYYKDEIAYQEIVDASKNQAELVGSLIIRANEQMVSVDFPNEFSGKQFNGKINFYSAVNKEWDREFPIVLVNNSMTVNRQQLRATKYKMMIAYTVDGKSYYQENDINLSK